MSKESFVWTDELVNEFGEFYKTKPYHWVESIERFKEYKNREWEVVSFRGDDTGLMHYKRQDGLYGPNKLTEEHLLSRVGKNATIHSVKRLSDGEVFTVGDEVEYREGDAVDWGYICGEGKINWIKEAVVQKDKMEVEINDNHEWSDNHYPHKYLENVRHKLPPQPKPEQPFPYFKPANQNFDKYGAPEQPKKERIEVLECLSYARSGNIFDSVFSTRIQLPDEIYPAIKEAIERVLNDEVSVDLPTLDGTTIHCQK